MEAVTHLSAAAATKVRENAARARREALIVTPLLIGTIVIYKYREDLFHLDEPIRLACALALVGLGWWLARDIGRAVRPALFKRMEAPTAGTVSFLIRLVLLGAALLAALQIGGVEPRTLAVGGAFTAVVVGLAAQNTLGNVLAGVLLISARPFRVGDRVRFQAGAIAGQIEGVVMALGLLYVTLAQGEDTIMVPNNVAMAAAVVPLREPAAVDLRARLSSDVKPSELQAFLEEHVQTPTRAHPHISVEEVDDEQVVMRIRAVPEIDRDGPQLADEILAAIGRVTGRAEGPALEPPSGRPQALVRERRAEQQQAERHARGHAIDRVERR